MLLGIAIIYSGAFPASYLAQKIYTKKSEEKEEC